LKSFQSTVDLEEWYTFRLVLYSLFHHTLECLVILILLEYLYQRESKVVMYFWTVSSKDSLLDISEVSMLLIAFLNSLIHLSSSSLFLMIVHHLSWINFLLMKMLTVKEAWSKELYKSGRKKWFLIFIELAWRNIRLITELESLGLSVY